MDGIMFWIATKKAPCLFNYNNLIKKKRLKLMGNLCPKHNKQNTAHSETDSIGSDLDFILRKYSTKKKNKAGLSKSRSFNKMSKIISTPKVARTLRRSFRKVQKHTMYVQENPIEEQNSQLDCSECNKEASVKKTEDQASLQENYVQLQCDNMSYMSGFTSTLSRTVIINRARNVGYIVFNNLDKEWNPNDVLVSRTRSGRCYGFHTLKANHTNGQPPNYGRILNNHINYAAHKPGAAGSMSDSDDDAS